MSADGAGEPKRQQRYEALAAGEQLGVVSVLGEQRQRLFNRGRRDVGELG